MIVLNHLAYQKLTYPCVMYIDERSTELLSRVLYVLVFLLRLDSVNIILISHGILDHNFFDCSNITTGQVPKMPLMSRNAFPKHNLNTLAKTVYSHSSYHNAKYFSS